MEWSEYVFYALVRYVLFSKFGAASLVNSLRTPLTWPFFACVTSSGTSAFFLSQPLPFLCWLSLSSLISLAQVTGVSTSPWSVISSVAPFTCCLHFASSMIILQVSFHFHLWWPIPYFSGLFLWNVIWVYLWEIRRQHNHIFCPVCVWVRQRQLTSVQWPASDSLWKEGCDQSGIIVCICSFCSDLWTVEWYFMQ